jgi:hypothetical protein
MTPATETAILAALEATGHFKAVASIAEASTQAVNSQTTPAAYVGFGGYDVLEVNSTRKATRINERWLVYVVSKQARQKGQQQARSEALDLASAAFSALAGMIPEGSAKPLEPVTPGERPAWDSGFSWVPLAFTHTTVLKS